MRQPIFQDQTGKRWRRIKTIFFSSLLVIGAILSIDVLNHYQIIDVQMISNVNSSIFLIIKKMFIYYLIFALIIGVLRLLILFYFSFRHWRKYKRGKKLDFDNQRLTVTVVIPASNEEVVIRKTVEAVLRSNYPIEEILVIDDGSKDFTAARVKQNFSDEPKVKLIRKKNGGKASALNIGFQKAVGDIVITIDADTVVRQTTIFHLVSHFGNPKIAAVSGNCKIGNIKNQLTLWQHIEYVTANNLEKRALHELDCITVVPGSNSAWRKQVVEEAGFFHNDTLAEDTDLTLRILNAGYRIVFDAEAISYEECPETAQEFLKQRFRWSYGIVQSLWKNRWEIIKSENKKLKYFAIPSMLFSYLLYLTSPIIDVLFIIALVLGVKSIYIYVLFFYLIDFLSSFYAFKLERENLKPLRWVIVQRIAYRYLIAYVTWKSFIVVLKGNGVGWVKSNRSGNNNYPL
ncbi:glycosyltransferase [Sporosarcina siberiensis]|uniref:Glycosyltransferase n=1 Tax=Sporosarcina siberiensis TaxID=1365606 RepID=A0ABW4SG62_9BACL